MIFTDLMSSTIIKPVQPLINAFSVALLIRDCVTETQARWPADQFRTLVHFIEKILQALNEEYRAGRVTEDRISEPSKELLRLVGFHQYPPICRLMLVNRDQRNRRRLVLFQDASRVRTSQVVVQKGGSSCLY